MIPSHQEFPLVLNFCYLKHIGKNFQEMIAPFKTAVVIMLLKNLLWSEIVCILLKELRCTNQTGILIDGRGRITLVFA